MVNPAIQLTAKTHSHADQKRASSQHWVSATRPATTTHQLSRNATIKCFDKYNIDQMQWPDTEEADFACRYFVPLIKEGVHQYIDNIHAELALLQLGHLVVPILIVNNNYENSYICSPYANYVSLAMERLDAFKNRFWHRLACSGLLLYGKLLRNNHINRVVYVNHWLLSTDLHPPALTSVQVREISTFLKVRYPKHAIIYRSLNEATTSPLKKALKNHGFKFVASRQIYLTNTSQKQLFETRIIKSDLKLWKDRDFDIVDAADMSEEDQKRSLELYKILSIDGHSHFNPKLNLKFIKLMIQQRLLRLKGFKRDGKIHGVIGFLDQQQEFLCPFFGYDKAHPETTRLYRLLSTCLLLEASKKEKIFHQSAGASFYKKIRRASAHIEYIGVYTRHLPKRQRLAWWIVKVLMNTASIPFLKKY